MPIWEYHCQNKECGYKLDKIIYVAKGAEIPDLIKCTECGAVARRSPVHVVSRPVIH